MANNKIFRIANHHESYNIWKKLGIRNKTLVHVDAHLDFQINYLIRYDKSQVNIGNYLFPSITDGLIDEVYWIIPGTGNISCAEFIYVIDKLRFAAYSDCKTSDRFSFDGKTVLSEIYGKKLTVCHLDNIYNLPGGSLLDIDCDFFTNTSASSSSPVASPFNKKSWIDLDAFVKSVQAKIRNASVATVCYSVKGGWTPLESKYLGDLVANKMGLPFPSLEQIVMSQRLLLMFRKALFLGNQHEMAKIYKSLSIIDPFVSENLSEYALPFLRAKKYKISEKIFRRLLSIDRKNEEYMSGLAITCFKMKKYPEAEKIFSQILSGSKSRILANIYLCVISLLDKKFEKAGKHLKSYLELTVKNNNISGYRFGNVAVPDDIRGILSRFPQFYL